MAQTICRARYRPVRRKLLIISTPVATIHAASVKITPTTSSGACARRRAGLGHAAGTLSTIRRAPRALSPYQRVIARSPLGG